VRAAALTVPRKALPGSNCPGGGSLELDHRFSGH
jgi:hypothetical protein